MKIRKRLLMLLMFAQLLTIIVSFAACVIADVGLFFYFAVCLNFAISGTMWFGFGRQVCNEYLLDYRIDYLTKEATRLWGLAKAGNSKAQQITAYELWKRMDAKRIEAMRIRAGEFEPEKQ